MEVKISCQGATTVSIDDLQDLQGNLKELSDDSYAKLRDSILEYGFSFPAFFWQDEGGTKWIIDSHQRKKVLLRLRDEGYTIPLLPADPIFAKDKIEAKKKLLLHESKYGEITPQGFEDFTVDLPMPEFEDLISIPEISTWGESVEDEPKQKSSKPKEEIKCPSCGCIFTPQP